MGVFSKHGYVKLEIPAWFDLRVAGPRPSPEEMQLAFGWLGRATEGGIDSVRTLLGRPDLDRYLRPLMTVVTVLDSQANDQILALGFAQGWTVADLERTAGLARSGRASVAALTAISLLRGTFGGENSLTLTNMLDAGYFANRTDLDPLAFMLRVVEGSGVKVAGDE